MTWRFRPFAPAIYPTKDKVAETITRFRIRLGFRNLGSSWNIIPDIGATKIFVMPLI